MLTVRTTAERLGLKEPTIRLWISLGKIAYVKLGRSVRVSEEEISRLIRENTIPRKRTK
jgi:excisionase family DNA binding protein